MQTKNPLRKLLKKQRQAHEKGHGQLALSLQGEINHFLKCQEVNKKKQLEKAVRKKRETMTEDEVFEEAQKWNQENLGDEKKRLSREKKMSDMEKKRSRSKKKRQITQQVQKIQEEDRLSTHTMSEIHNKGFLQHVKGHEATLKVEKSDEIDGLYNEISHKGLNKKKTQKAVTRILENKCILIEMAIQGYMEEHNVPYEDAKIKVYEIMNKPPSPVTNEDEPRIEEIENNNVAKL